jgi:hypothetical protein
MPSSGMWRRVDLVRTNVSEECMQPPARAGSCFADFSTLMMEAIRSSETSVHTRSTWRHIPEGGKFNLCVEHLTLLIKVTNT